MSKYSYKFGTLSKKYSKILKKFYNLLKLKNKNTLNDNFERK